MRHSDAVANTANNRQPRIVSLLPGATDLIVALGLERQLVGISAHCNLPEHMAPLPRVNMGLIPASTVEPAAIDAEVRRRISMANPSSTLMPISSKPSSRISSSRSRCVMCVRPHQAP